MIFKPNKITIGLAPMEGISDFPLRLWIYFASKPDYTWTPFLRITQNYPIHRIPEKWCPELLNPELKKIIPYTIIPQLMAPTPDMFSYIAENLLEKTSFIDLNCGCPSPKVVGKGSGSALLKDMKALDEHIATISKNIGSKNLSVKIRTGYTDTNLYDDIINILEGYSLHHLTIHGRTREQSYRGNSDWDLIEKAAAKLAYPVIGSGDINTIESYTEKISLSPNISSVIIGRGALRNPFLFKEIKEKNKTQISQETLIYSLATFALLNKLYSDHYDTLIKTLLKLLPTPSPLKNEILWKDIFIKLSKTSGLKEISPFELELSRPCLGRTKLLWNYFRSSLPQVFFAPQIFRSSSFKSMLESINIIANSLENNNIDIQWNESLNWVYSGEKKKPLSKAAKEEEPR